MDAAATTIIVASIPVLGGMATALINSNRKICMLEEAHETSQSVQRVLLKSNKLILQSLKDGHMNGEFESMTQEIDETLYDIATK